MTTELDFKRTGNTPVKQIACSSNLEQLGHGCRKARKGKGREKSLNTSDLRARPQIKKYFCHLVSSTAGRYKMTANFIAKQLFLLAMVVVARIAFSTSKEVS